MSGLRAKSAQSVQQALNQARLECTVVELPSSTRTASEAAQAIGCNVSQIVKSLIFKTKHTSKPVLVLVSGPNRVDEGQIEAYAGEPIVKADASFAREVTGFAIGGIPPIGHKTMIEMIYIDAALMGLDTVWAAAGTPNAVFCIKSKDLALISNAKIVSVSS